MYINNIIYLIGLIKDIFKWKIENRLDCVFCNSQRTKTEPMLMIPLPISNYYYLNESFQYHSETINI